MKSLFLCPVCAQPLERQDRIYRCPANHCFDLSSAGYTYLMPTGGKHAKQPGDSKEMAASRNRFLSAGYYAPLAAALAEIYRQHKAPHILDAGCGEGYYTAQIFHALEEAGYAPRMAGIDISKSCLRWAAKREPRIEFAVASSYHLPIASQNIDLLINCFSPLCLDEFQRVLKPGGIFLYVVPGARHLWELKQVLYPEPYPNTERLSSYPGFAYLSVKHVDAVIHLPTRQAIHDLFQMTPYYWKTPKAGSDRLAQLDTLDTEISFRIHIFRKIDM